MVPNGSQWFTMVPSGSQSFSIITSDSKWLPVVYSGSQWFSVILNVPVVLKRQMKLHVLSTRTIRLVVL